MDKDAILVDHRRGRGIRVGRTDLLRLVDREHLLIVKDLAVLLVDADSEQLSAIQGGGGHPDLVPRADG